MDKILKIDELYGVYVRSFTVMEDGFTLCQDITTRRLSKAAFNSSRDGFDILKEYQVADQAAGMVQLVKIGDFYYITISTDNQGESGRCNHTQDRPS